MEKISDATKFTKPIQILAAWLITMFLMSASFLTAAANISNTSWISIVLVFASILCVPIFLYGLFKLQTKYRAEMQDDEYYSAHVKWIHSYDSGQKEQIIVSDSRIIGSECIDLDSESNEIKVQTLITINSSVKQLETISTRLMEDGLCIDEKFDSKFSADNYHLSFGNDVDTDILKKVFKVCKDNGLSSVSFSKSSAARNKIYIGSMGFKRADRLILDADSEILNSLLAKNTLTFKMLRSIIITHGVKKRAL